MGIKITIALLCSLAILSNTEGVDLVPGPAYVANYASSYNAHTVSHDIRVPVAAPVTAFTNIVASPYTAVVQPAARIAVSTPITVPAAPVAAPIASVAAPVAPVAAPVTPVRRIAQLPTEQLIASYQIPQVPYLAAPVTTLTNVNLVPQAASAPDVDVEQIARLNSPNNQQKLDRSVESEQARNQAQPASATPNFQTTPVPNEILASSQFFARQLPFTNMAQAGGETQFEASRQRLREGNNQEVNRHVAQPQIFPGFNPRQVARRPDEQGLSFSNIQRFNTPQDQAQADFRRAPNAQQQNLFPNARNEKLNAESESVEVNAQNTNGRQIADRAENRLQPTANLISTQPRLFVNPSTQFIPNVYNQVITF